MMKREKMVSVCVLINLCQLEKNDARLGFSKEKNLNSQGAGCIFLFWKELRCYQVFIFVPGSSALHIGTDTCVPGPGSMLSIVFLLSSVQVTPAVLACGLMRLGI